MVMGVGQLIGWQVTIARDPKDTPKEHAVKVAKARAEAWSDFLELVNVEQIDDFQPRWAALKDKWAGSQRNWIGYLQGQWVTRKEQWCRAWRKVSLPSTTLFPPVDCVHHRRLIIILIQTTILSRGTTN